MLFLILIFHHIVSMEASHTAPVHLVSLGSAAKMLSTGVPIYQKYTQTAQNWTCHSVGLMGLVSMIQKLAPLVTVATGGMGLSAISQYPTNRRSATDAYCTT